MATRQELERLFVNCRCWIIPDLLKGETEIPEIEGWLELLDGFSRNRNKITMLTIYMMLAIEGRCFVPVFTRLGKVDFINA